MADMKKRTTKKPADDKIVITVPSASVKDVRAAMKGLGVSADCAVELMLVATRMRLGGFKTRKAYADEIRGIEKDYDVKVAGRMPGFLKGGDPLFIARFRTMGEKPKKGKRK